MNPIQPLAVLLLATLCALPAHAALTWTRVLTGLTQPVDISGARDGSGRLFIVQQTGQIRVVRNGALLATPYLNIRGLVTASGEQGLLGIAFHPQFATNRQFYVNYTRAGDGATVIARYTAPTAASDTADPASAQILLLIPQPYSNHNGGALKFGPDGYLYIPLGDGGSGNDPQARAQDRTTLRQDPAHRRHSGNPYAIPPTNPWANGVGGRPEILRGRRAQSVARLVRPRERRFLDRRRRAERAGGDRPAACRHGCRRQPGLAHDGGHCVHRPLRTGGLQRSLAHPARHPPTRTASAAP